MKETLISLPHFIIAYLTSAFGSGRHLRFAHILNTCFKAVHVDLRLGGRHLSITDTFGMTTLKAMKCRYIRTERRWIHEEEILEDMHYDINESYHESDSIVNFDERDYLGYSFL
ncbi:hypothetical protein Scep_007346 [Stephania cephalantha]|uniref:Uncharacterized protein n=1 Tax=Stephania cephalantha TaxID=152367 RepID=A0AAP0KBE8_9MAGN